MTKARILVMISVFALFSGSTSVFSQEKENVGSSKPIAIKGLEVYPEDLPDYHLSDAIAACMRKNEINSLGHNDWRVPTSRELGIIFEHRHEIYGLRNGLYLSSEQWKSGRVCSGRKYGIFGPKMCTDQWSGNYFDFTNQTIKIIKQTRGLPAAHVRLVRGDY